MTFIEPPSALSSRPAICAVQPSPGAEHCRHAQNDAEHAAGGSARCQLNRRCALGEAVEARP
jgi:hypothetical protein